MRFIFVSTPTFEPWDWTNPDTKGIGGSETSHIEMSRRLAQRGHEVISYAPVPFTGTVIGPGGVTWSHTDNVDFSLTGIWVVYRDPGFCVRIPANAGAVWHIAQDTEYIGFNRRKEFIERNYNGRISRVVTLCKDHATYIKREHPKLANLVCTSSNGVKQDLFEELPVDVPRNSKRLMFASSPDRGLLPLLHIFQHARELVPDLELHVCYGFNNLETWVRGVKEQAAKDSKQSQAEYNLHAMQNALDIPGVTVHGRLQQMELAMEWLKSGIWCHPSNFSETSCITSMDAQALGAIPITIPYWAVGENVQHGVFIQGNASTDPLTRARFAFEAAKLACDPERQESIRHPMMHWARRHFDWERFVDQWEEWGVTDGVMGDLDRTIHMLNDPCSPCMVEVVAQ
jgi:glycosyltransferase involved in cell wall biosynthesis